jgi:hypothetical protein
VGEIISESVGGIIPERRAASPGIGIQQEAGQGTTMITALKELYEHHAEDCTRAAERTDDSVFRKMLLMVALQWRLAAQEEASKQPTGGPNDA